MTEATNDGSGCGSNGLPGPDVYHTFIPNTRGPWRFDLCDTAAGWDTVISIHRNAGDPLAAACPTSAANRIAGGCDDDGCSAFFGQVPSVIRAVSLEPGTQYTVRIGAFDGASFTDTYQLTVTDLNVTNDRCEDADASPIDGAGGLVFGELTNATTDGSVDAFTCLGSVRAGSVRDVYHLFTPQTSGRWTFSTCVSGTEFIADTVVSIHTGCPASAANAIACNNDGCESRPGSSVVSAQLEAGVTYRIRVAEFLRDRFDGSFAEPQYFMNVTNETTGACCSPTLGVCEVVGQAACAAGSAFTPGAACQPLGEGPGGSCAVGSYDECSQAVALIAETSVAASTAGLTGTADGSCSSLTADGWFTFTAPQAGVYRLIAQPQMSMLGLLASVFADQACPPSPASELSCGFVFGDGPQFMLAAGQTVRIRIAATGVGRFTIRMSLSGGQPPVNDLCPDATRVARDVPAAGSFTGASGGLPMQTCSSGLQDVWYTYTAPSSVRTRISVFPTPDSFTFPTLSVSSECTNAATPLACVGEPGSSEDPTVLTFMAAAGVTYRIRVSTNALEGDFSLLISDAPPPPGNDACAGAAALNLNTSMAGSTRNATDSTGDIGTNTCTSAAAADVWYQFQPAAAGAYEVNATPATELDPGVGLGVFAGCPTAGATDLACAGPAGPGSSNTVRFLAAANAVYLIRVGTLPGPGSDFNIVVAPASSSLGACCLRDGGCFVGSPEDCAFFGTYSGDSVACDAAGCPPMGRCCFSGSSSCAVTSQSDCTGPGTSFTADEACYPVGCPAGTPPANDLCQNAPTLALPAEVLTALDLADAEGPSIPAGFCGTTQSLDLGLDRSVYYRFVAPSSGSLNIDIRLVNFPEPMLVLYRGSSCAQLLDIDCTYRFQAGERKTFEVVGGETYYLGLGIRNDPTFMNEGGLIGLGLSMESAAGACCRGTACTVESADACGGSGGVFQGQGSVCGVEGNPTTCCRANFNGVGGVTVQDIFDFLGAYFTADPAADLNGSGTVTVQDIFDFLGAYFAGC